MITPRLTLCQVEDMILTGWLSTLPDPCPSCFAPQIDLETGAPYTHCNGAQNTHCSRRVHNVWTEHKEQKAIVEWACACNGTAQKKSFLSCKIVKQANMTTTLVIQCFANPQVLFQNSDLVVSKMPDKLHLCRANNWILPEALLND